MSRISLLLLLLSITTVCCFRPNNGPEKDCLIDQDCAPGLKCDEDRKCKIRHQTKTQENLRASLERLLSTSCTLDVDCWPNGFCDLGSSLCDTTSPWEIISSEANWAEITGDNYGSTKEVTIPSRLTLKIDSAFSAKVLTIHGTVEINCLGELIAGQIIVSGTGKLIVGNAGSELTCEKNPVSLSKETGALPLTLDDGTTVAAPCLVVKGTLKYYGAIRTPTMVRAGQTARRPQIECYSNSTNSTNSTNTTDPSQDDMICNQTFSNVLILDQAVSTWAEGNPLLILPFYKNPSYLEATKIAKIINSTAINTTDYFYVDHYGCDAPEGGGATDMRTELVNYRRSLNFWCAQGRYYFYGGADIYIQGASLANVDVEINGTSSVVLDNVAIIGSAHYNLKISNIPSATIRDSVFYNSQLYNVWILDSVSNLHFENNIATYAMDTKSEESNSSSIIANLYITTPPTSSIFQGNTFAVSEKYNVILQGVEADATCTPLVSSSTFTNNIAHTADINLLVTNDGLSTTADCVKISGWILYGAVKAAATGWINTKYLSISDMEISDAGYGLALSIGVDDESVSSIKGEVKNVYFSGHRLNSTCGSTISWFWQNTLMDVTEFSCTQNYGIYLPLVTLQPKGLNDMSGWWKPTTKTVDFSTWSFSNITFANFYGNSSFRYNQTPTGCSCGDNFPIHFNPYAGDSSPLYTFSEVIYENVSVPASEILWEQSDSTNYLNSSDCGSFACTGNQNIVIRDLDGTLARNGTTSATLLPPNKFAWIQDACQALVAEGNAATLGYKCPDTIWGYLVIKPSSDSYGTTAYEPVTIQQSINANILNRYKADGSGKRLARFHSLIQEGESYFIQFTTLPKPVDFQVFGIENTKLIYISIQFESTTSPLVMVQSGGTNSSGPVTLVDETSPGALQAAGTTSCGGYAYDPEYNQVTFVVVGSGSDPEGCLVAVAQQQAVLFKTNFQTTADSFVNGGGINDFKQKVANIAKIPTSNVRILSIKTVTEDDTFDEPSFESGIVITTSLDYTASGDFSSLNEFSTSVQTSISGAMNNGSISVGGVAAKGGVFQLATGDTISDSGNNTTTISESSSGISPGIIALLVCLPILIVVILIVTILIIRKLKRENQPDKKSPETNQDDSPQKPEEKPKRVLRRTRPPKQVLEETQEIKVEDFTTEAHKPEPRRKRVTRKVDYPGQSWQQTPQSQAHSQSQVTYDPNASYQVSFRAPANNSRMENSVDQFLANNSFSQQQTIDANAGGLISTNQPQQNTRFQPRLRKEAGNIEMTPGQYYQQ